MKPVYCYILRGRAGLAGFFLACVFLTLQPIFAQEGQPGGLSKDANFTRSLPPSVQKPQTPVSILMNTLENPHFREAVRRENERFKLLNMASLPGQSLSTQQRSLELVEAFSKDVSKIVLTNIRDQLKERAETALKDSAFDRVFQLAEYTKNITKSLKTSDGTRSIATHFNPNPLEPKLQIQNLGIETIQLAYNTQDEAPSVFLEQSITPTVKSQLNYDMLLQKLDSALKIKINDTINCHMINSNQINQTHEKSVIFGISIQLP